MEKVWPAEVSTPPLVVPPLSCARTVTVTLPPRPDGVNVSVPFVVIAGWMTNKPVLSLLNTRLTTWLDSFAAPAKMFVTTAATVTATPYLSTVTELIARLNEGASFTDETVKL